MSRSVAELKRLMEQGENISALLRKEKDLAINTEEIIEIAYDLQAGSYIEALEKTKHAEQMLRCYRAIAELLKNYCHFSSILEAGVGEATTLSGVLANLEQKVQAYGFDLSWSRIAHARSYMNSKGLSSDGLCTGNLLNIPFADNSVDLVYTCHSIEPNGGNEEPILAELYRVCRKYLILFEPAYEFADDKVKKRMRDHGYCRGLADFAKKLGFKVIEHALFHETTNPMNPTAVTVIEKGTQGEFFGSVFACPRHKTPLKRFENVFFSPEALVAYPIINNIPCLRIENGILASHFENFI